MSKRKAAPNKERTASPLSAEMVPAARLALLVLRDARFTLHAPWPDDLASGEADVQIRFNLTASRLGTNRMAVDFGVEVQHEEVFESAVSYRLFFEIDAPSPDEGTELMRSVAARVAPVVAFPYIREMIHSFTARAGAPLSAVLPVLNVGALIKPENVVVEEWEGDESDLQPK